MSTPESAAPADGGDHAGRQAPHPPKAPVPLVLSCATGALGLVLLMGGALIDNTALSVAGVVGGALSLGAALYWRSLLISDWAAQKRARPRR